MTRNAILAAGTALATLALGGCATADAPRADLSASQAEVAMAKGKHEQAIEHAEAAVLAEPRNATYRATLASAYLNGGRFRSAATSFADAMALGDESARTALGLALAQIASADHVAAAELLDDWRDDIAPADLGLALALAGHPERGVHVLSNAVRSGENTPKVRQNLAYAFALQGDWRSARLMAAEDVAADEVGDRLAEWAAMAQPEHYQLRIAKLLDAPMVADAGQPAHLALGNFPEGPQLAAAQAVAEPATVAAPEPQVALAQIDASELPALNEGKPVEQIAVEAPAAAPAPAPAPAPEPTPTTRPAQRFAAASPVTAAVATVASQAIRYITSPVVQEVPVSAPRAEAVRAAPVRVAAAPKRVAGGKHLVQLGSFGSKADARRAWTLLSGKYAQLSDYTPVVSEARVKGKTYFRISAAGFDRAGAVSMCRKVAARGDGCITWAEGSPLPGAIDTGVRMAAR